MSQPSVLGPESIALGLGLRVGKNGWVQHLVARECFMNAMVAIVPESLATLISDLGESLALDAIDDGTFPIYTAEPNDDGSWTMMIRRKPVALIGYIHQWKRMWNVRDGWVDILVAETLACSAYRQKHGLSEIKRFVTVPPSALLALGDAPSKQQPEEPDMLGPFKNIDDDGNPLPIWNPFDESRAEAKARLIKQLSHLVDEDLDAIQEQFAQRNLVPTPVKRQPEHFDWLVHYQVLEWSQDRIRRSLAPTSTRQAIAKAIHETARLVGLTLRPPGRAGAPGHGRVLDDMVQCREDEA